MQLEPEQISRIIRSQIKYYQNAIEQTETGTVTMVGDGIARAAGLDNCMAGELVQFDSGTYGMAQNLEENSVSIVLLGDDSGIKDNVIVDVKFLTFGCGAAIATSSMATDLIKGKTIDEALKLTNKAVVEALEGLPPIKVHCSVLAEQAVKAALSDYYRRQGIDPEPIVGKLEEDCDHCESCGH